MFTNIILHHLQLHPPPTSPPSGIQGYVNKKVIIVINLLMLLWKKVPGDKGKIT